MCNMYILYYMYTNYYTHIQKQSQLQHWSTVQQHGLSSRQSCTLQKGLMKSTVLAAWDMVDGCEIQSTSWTWWQVDVYPMIFRGLKNHPIGIWIRMKEKMDQDRQGMNKWNHEWRKQRMTNEWIDHPLYDMINKRTNKQTNKQKNKGWGDALKICKKKTKKQTNSTSMTSKDSHLSEA